MGGNYSNALTTGKIKNDLITNTSGYVLDAYQGKVLNDKFGSYIEKSQIVDSIEIDSTSKVLSAKTGKFLGTYCVNNRNSIDSMNLTLINLSNDVNTNVLKYRGMIPHDSSLLTYCITNASGIWYYEKQSADTPDSAAWGWMLVIQWGSVHAARLALTGFNCLYISRYVYGSEYGTWVRVQ